ncbi:Uncharacterized protein APZ42_019429 [Daphnia magna]|uniref:Uncharacterized protein n=1 Tax=Daphnia magna TaxID=35525 RepID=A0A164Y5E6_9CRUS|nr:Uncharacterized protein APZ42_019429 [Daphnia magna]
MVLMCVVVESGSIALYFSQLVLSQKKFQFRLFMNGSDCINNNLEIQLESIVIQFLVKRLPTTENKLGQNIAVCSDKNLASSVLNNKVPSKIELFDCRIYN